MPYLWLFLWWVNTYGYIFSVNLDCHLNLQYSDDCFVCIVENMYVFTTYALRWPLGDLNINIIHKNRYLVLLNWFQPYPTPMLKNADYVGKTTDIFVPVCCNYILWKYLVGLNNRKFLLRTLCWSSYEDDVLYQHFTWKKLRTVVRRVFVFTYAHVEYIKCALQSLVILIQKKKDVVYEMSTT
jgi:hypothetical protein